MRKLDKRIRAWIEDLMNSNGPFTRILEVCKGSKEDVDRDILYTIHCRLDRRAAMLKEPEQQIREPSCRVYDLDPPQTIKERIMMWAQVWLVEPGRIASVENRLAEILEV